MHVHLIRLLSLSLNNDASVCSYVRLCWCSDLLEFVNMAGCLIHSISLYNSGDGEKIYCFHRSFRGKINRDRDGDGGRARERNWTDCKCGVANMYMYKSYTIHIKIKMLDENRFQILVENQMTGKQKYTKTKGTNQMVKAKANGGIIYFLFRFLFCCCFQIAIIICSAVWFLAFCQICLLLLSLLYFSPFFPFCFLCFSPESNDRYERISISLNRFLLPLDFLFRWIYFID